MFATFRGCLRFEVGVFRRFLALLPATGEIFFSPAVLTGMRNMLWGRVCRTTLVLVQARLRAIHHDIYDSLQCSPGSGSVTRVLGASGAVIVGVSAELSILVTLHCVCL